MRERPAVRRAEAPRALWTSGKASSVHPTHPAPYDGQTIDVLGLSCYTWNWKRQGQIAKAVKRRHPNCLVVAGGPEPDYKDKDVFRMHPYIDMVAVKDGEVTFTRISKQGGRGLAGYH